MKLSRQHSVWRTSTKFPLFPTQNQQTLFLALLFSKSFSTSQFRIRKMEMNKVSKTTHIPSGLVLRITPSIFLCTIRLYQRNLFWIFYMEMSRLTSEKKIKFLVLKSLQNTSTIQKSSSSWNLYMLLLCTIEGEWLEV